MYRIPSLAVSFRKSPLKEYSLPFSISSLSSTALPFNSPKRRPSLHTGSQHRLSVLQGAQSSKLNPSMTGPPASAISTLRYPSGTWTLKDSRSPSTSMERVLRYDGPPSD